MQFGLSLHRPAFHQSRALMNSAPDIWEKQLLHFVSVVSCKQPCGVMPHLPQELALPWEGGTETLNGGKIEMACFDKTLFCSSYAEEKSCFIQTNLL